MSPDSKSPKIRPEVKIGRKMGKIEVKLTDRKPQIEPSKVESIVEAFEKNTIVGESAPNMSETNSKKIVVNAFSKMMNSKEGGATPTSGKKKAKRLEKVKPTGSKIIDRWILKEKSQ